MAGGAFHFHRNMFATHTLRNKHSNLASCKAKLSLCTTSWKCAGHVARMGKRKGLYRVLVGKP